MIISTALRENPELATLSFFPIPFCRVCLGVIFLLCCFFQSEAQGWQRVYPYALYPDIGMGRLSDGNVVCTYGARARILDVDTGEPLAFYSLEKGPCDTINALHVLPNDNLLWVSDVYDCEVEEESAKRPELLLMDINGTIEWQEDYPIHPGDVRLFDATIGADGNILAVGTVHPETDTTKLLLLEVEPEDGDSLWSNVETLNNFGMRIFGVENTADGGFFVYGSAQQSASEGRDLLLIKLNNAKEIVDIHYFGEDLPEEGTSILQSGDGNFYLTGFRVLSANERQLYCLKIDQDATVLWATDFEGLSVLYNPVNGVVGEDNALVVASSFSLTGGFVDGDTYLTKIRASDGTLEWDRLIGTDNSEFPYGITYTPTKSYVVMGESIQAVDDVSYTFAFRTNLEGFIFSNTLTGNVFVDTNDDCIFDDTDLPFFNRLVHITGDTSLLLATDTMGNFTAHLDTGTYQIDLLSLSDLWSLDESCSNSTVTFSNQDETQISHFTFENPTDICPFLEINISTPFLRRGFSNFYTVTYQNTGTEAADDVNIVVQLDEWMTHQSSSIPVIADGLTLNYDIGLMEVGAIGQFEIEVLLAQDVEMGATHCVEAMIKPSELCGWEGPIITTEAVCEGDSVKLIIRNVGSDMNEDLSFYITEDVILLFEQDTMVTLRENSNFSLQAGDSLVFVYPAEGQNFFIKANQALGFPGGLFSANGVENCGSDEDGNHSTGLLAQYPIINGLPTNSTDCQNNIGSFDPNDKVPTPIGIHFSPHKDCPNPPVNCISPNSPLIFNIRFQNTGTDTAFTVIILDTLSEHLNPLSLVPLASSHDYKLEIISEQILQITFSDILLPDSTTNERASHGFIRFFIQPKSNLSEGTVITNKAAIYFDFNEPVITNTTLHTVDNCMQCMISPPPPPPDPALEKINVYPNPAQQTVFFEINDMSFQTYTLEIFNPIGDLIYQQDFSTPQWQWTSNDWNSGLFFYRVWGEESHLLKSGKLIIQ